MVTPFSRGDCSRSTTSGQPQLLILLDLRKIPAIPGSLPERSASFSSEHVPMGTYSSDKSHTSSLGGNSDGVEVLRKSSLAINRHVFSELEAFGNTGVVDCVFLIKVRNSLCNSHNTKISSR